MENKEAKDISYDMPKQICVTCGESKSKIDFYQRYKTCKTCIKKRRKPTINENITKNLGKTRFVPYFRVKIDL